MRIPAPYGAHGMPCCGERGIPGWRVTSDRSRVLVLESVAE